MFQYQFRIGIRTCKKKTQKTIYLKSKRGGGEDSNHEIAPKQPESEYDKSETIEQPTRPK